MRVFHDVWAFSGGRESQSAPRLVGPRTIQDGVGGGDAPGDTTTTEVLPVGGSVSGTVGGGDRDWYAVTLVAGAQYTFQTSVSAGSGTRDPYLVLRDAFGANLADDDDSGGGLNARIDYTAEYTGAYYIDIRELGSAPSITYQISATQTAAPPADDGMPAGISATASLSVGGSVDGAVALSGDADWYRVTLTAGQSYRFDLTGAPGAGALIDPFLALYGSGGAIITYNDDGGPDIDASLRFTPTVSGTYFIAASGFEGATGTYRLSAAAVAPQDPLDTIDWGANLASNQVRIYFARTGETFLGETAERDWTSSEQAAALQAAATFAAVSNLTFTQVSSAAAATMILVLDPALDAAGQMTTPPTLPAVGVFNTDPSYWTAASLRPGGAAFSTLLHEIGHALGLAHPHDDGGASEVMEGVTGWFDSYGVAGLNQGAYTVMTYNDGWPGGPPGPLTSYSSGSAGTPMALDVALLQQKYGSVAANTGDTVYDLGAVLTSSQLYYRAIWDTGGVDTILFEPAQDVTIDLRPATLTNTVGGGGYVSGVMATGSGGGFTIAAGVEIENATSGDGDDHLVGNALGNVLQAGGGDDIVDGGAGSDILIGGAGSDTLIGGGGSATAPDYMFGGTGNDTYCVNSAMTGPQDLVDEGEGNPALAGSASDIDTIISQGALFWDYYSVAERLIVDRDAGSQIVGGKNVMNKTIVGDIGTDIVLTYGRSSVVDAGAGIDATSFGLLGLDESYDGVNTLIMKPGSGMDYLYEFESGVDKIDLSGFGYGLTGAQWDSFLVDIDNGDDDYCFLYLGLADHYLVFVGTTSAQVAAGDFIG